jgi:hypothetical protein
VNPSKRQPVQAVGDAAADCILRCCTLRHQCQAGAAAVVVAGVRVVGSSLAIAGAVIVCAVRLVVVAEAVTVAADSS